MYKIVNLREYEGKKEKVIFCDLVKSENGELVISGRLNYVLDRIQEKKLDVVNVNEVQQNQ